MTITPSVHKQFFATDNTAEKRQRLIRLSPTVIVKYEVEDKAAQARAQARASQQPPPRAATKRSNRRTNLWTVEEHNRFLHGLELYPRGPWKLVAAVVGTRTTRQTMTHAQKYRQKIGRHASSQDIPGSRTASTEQDEVPPHTSER